LLRIPQQSNITFEAQVLYDIPNRSSQIKFADMDGDGKLDLITNPNILETLVYRKLFLLHLC
jgi:hypothetical protein